MKKKLIFGSIIVLFLVVLFWFGSKNKDSIIDYETDKMFKTNIVKKSVATGKVKPLEEVEIKPKVSGIIQKIYVEEGAKVKAGDLIATIRVVPNIQSLNSAKGGLEASKLRYNNERKTYERNKKLFDDQIISKQEFEAIELRFNSTKQELDNAKNNLEIIQKGTASGLGNTANTNIKAEISGTILEIPVREGNQVIESNTFNSGTTIATIADMTKMIFEGTVDETEVGKIKSDTKLLVALGAIENKKYDAQLSFIAPKGTEDNGAVKFKIKASLNLDDQFYIRAGYSANAEIILEKRDSVLSLKESLIQFDKETEDPYVEVKTGDNSFEKKSLKLGISDGINVEVLSGLEKDDEIKIWNKLKNKESKEEE